MWLEVLYWIDHVCFVRVFCMSEVISSFRSLRTGVCSSYVVSLCDFAYYVIG